MTNHQPAECNMPLSRQFLRSTVLAAQIDFSDLSCRLSPLPPAAEDDALAASIRRTGLLHPPILRPRGDLYQLVNGHRRSYTAVHQLRCTSLHCLMLPPETGDREALALALEAIVCKRSPTIMERALFCQKMLDFLDEQELAADFLPLMGLAPTPFLVRRQAELAALEEPFAVALHQGRLQESVARELLAISLPERLALYELIDWLQLSAGNQKKVTQTCRELSRRQRVSLLKILGSEEIKKILDHPEMNVPQKTAALMQHLGELRYPRLAAATAEFNAWCRSLRLPEDWSVTPTRSFEDDRVTLTMTLENREILQQRLPRLRAAVKGEYKQDDA